MARKTKAAPIEGAEMKNEAEETVVLWKATMPLSVEEHQQLSAKLRHEQERSGVRILLVPFSADAEISTEPAQEPATEVTHTGADESKADGGEVND